MDAILRTVPDTNVIVAAHKSESETSPNKEYFSRWVKDEFEILYSRDTLLEYIEKLQEKKIPYEVIEKLYIGLRESGKRVEIQHFRLRKYPQDPDDISFVLCAFNGKASHLISCDRHLLDLQSHFEFQICDTITFLTELRELQS